MSFFAFRVRTIHPNSVHGIPADGLYGMLAAGPILFPVLTQRLAGPMSAQQLRVKAASPPMINAGLSVCQVTVRGGKTEALKYSKPSNPQAEHLHWSDFTVITEADLRRGIYAVVKCMGEDFLRMLDVQPTDLGEACGHAGLASEKPVLFAGEVELNDSMELTAWTNVSGTYQIPQASALQSGLPPDLFWRFVKREDAQGHHDVSQLRFLRDGHAWEPPCVQASGPTPAEQAEPGFAPIKRASQLPHLSEGRRKTAKPEVKTEPIATARSCFTEVKQETGADTQQRRLGNTCEDPPEAHPDLSSKSHGDQRSEEQGGKRAADGSTRHKILAMLCGFASGPRRPPLSGHCVRKIRS